MPRRVSMKNEPPKQVTLPELSSGWEKLLQEETMPSELSYRIHRLIDRSLALTDKMFLKTLKGREMIWQCAEQTLLVRNELESGGNRLYETLTELEKIYEDLLKKTYQFRVKAG
jgi:hypothetical protein